MFALVQWIVDKTISVVSIDDVMDSKNEGDTSFVKYGTTCFMATIIRVSEDRKYLSSVKVGTDGKIIQKLQKRALSTKNVEKKTSLANTKKREKSGALRSADLEEENLLRMRPIFDDSDSNSIGENAASISKRPRLDLDADVFNNRRVDENDASLTKSPQSGYCDAAVADANREIEELEKLLADKLLSRQNLQQKKAIQSQPKTKKLGSKRTLEYVGIVEDEDNEMSGPASTENRHNIAKSGSHYLPQHSQQNHTRGSKRVSQTQLYNQEAQSNGDDEEQARLQSDGSTQFPNRLQQRQLGGIGEQRIPEPRNRTVEDEVDNLQLCRQGGAGRVLLVEHHNVWIDKAELMYCQRWVDNAPEMARRLLRLLVGNKNLIHMCACGYSKDPLIRGIPPDILRSVEYYVNKKCSSRLQPARFITIVNMMCQTLRHPKK